MTNQITVSQNGTVTRYEPIDEEEGSYGIAPDEVRPPVLKYDGKLGEFTNGITGEVTKSVRLVLLRKLPQTRVKLNPDMESTDVVQCQSVDMLRPVDAEQASAIGAGPTCAECPFAQFGQDATGRPIKSACSEQWNLVVASDENEPFPFLFRAKSTAIKPIRMLLNQLEIMRKTKRGVPGYMRRFELAAGPLTANPRSAMQKWFPLTATVLPELVPAERAESYSGLWNMIRDAQISAVITGEPDEPDGAVLADQEGGGPEMMTAEELDAWLRSEAGEPFAAGSEALPVNEPAAAAPMPQSMAIPPAASGATLPGMPAAQLPASRKGAH